MEEAVLQRLLHMEKEQGVPPTAEEAAKVREEVSEEFAAGVREARRSEETREAEGEAEKAKKVRAAEHPYEGHDPRQSLLEAAQGHTQQIMQFLSGLALEVSSLRGSGHG